MILKVIPNNFVYVLFNGILFFIPLERKIEMKIVMKKVQIIQMMNEKFLPSFPNPFPPPFRKK